MEVLNTDPQKGDTESVTVAWTDCRCPTMTPGSQPTPQWGGIWRQLGLDEARRVGPCDGTDVLFGGTQRARWLSLPWEGARDGGHLHARTGVLSGLSRTATAAHGGLSRTSP